MSAILVVFTAIYCGIIAFFVAGWCKMPNFRRSENNEKLPPLSVIVCFRNEAENLPPLLESILCQTFQNFELIFANDHSSDLGCDFLQNASKKNSNILLFDTEGFGKKNGLREAIKRAKNNLIFCCDADCVLPKTLFEEIAQFHATNKPDLLIGGVKYSISTLFEALQATEFGSLVASGAGSCGAKTPILCNGANLSFTKTTWEKFGENLNEKTTSGDDIFLLQNVKAAKGKIHFLKSPTAFVTTKPTKNVRQFFAQHQRWAGKTKFYTDWQTIFVAMVVFGWCLAWILSAISAFFVPKMVAFVAICWLAKLAVDCCLLVPFFCFSQQKKLIFAILPTAIFYPIYVVFTALSSLFTKEKWRYNN